jgi:hypothetical protein
MSLSTPAPGPAGGGPFAAAAFAGGVGHRAVEGESLAFLHARVKRSSPRMSRAWPWPPGLPVALMRLVGREREILEPIELRPPEAP